MESANVAEPPLATSPLGGLFTRVGNGALQLSERPFLGKLALRGDAGDPGFVAAASAALGCALPRAPGAGVAHDRRAILCLAPDEWLVVSEAGRGDLVGPLRQALGGRSIALVDVSCATATVSVGGPDAAALLRKVCSIDLVRQTARACWQTRLGAYAVLIHRGDAPVTFDLHVARSYARSFWLWLSDAAAEFEIRAPINGSGG
jgi:sarcosine oxidase subunit gamma